jgi:hypothetical protein
MKNRVVSGAAALIAGGLIAWGPQFLFRICGHIPDAPFMRCHWSGQAEIGVGTLIAALGALLLISKKTDFKIAYSFAVILSALLALFIPNVLIGGCSHPEMACRTTAFPALTVISLLLILFFVLNIFYLCYAGKRR